MPNTLPASSLILSSLFSASDVLKALDKMIQVARIALQKFYNIRHGVKRLEGKVVKKRDKVQLVNERVQSGCVERVFQLVTKPLNGKEARVTVQKTESAVELDEIKCVISFYSM